MNIKIYIAFAFVLGLSIISTLYYKNKYLSCTKTLYGVEVLKEDQIADTKRAEERNKERLDKNKAYDERIKNKVMNDDYKQALDFIITEMQS